MESRFIVSADRLEERMIEPATLEGQYANQCITSSPKVMAKGCPLLKGFEECYSVPLKLRVGILLR